MSRRSAGPFDAELERQRSLVEVGLHLRVTVLLQARQVVEARLLLLESSEKEDLVLKAADLQVNLSRIGRVADHFETVEFLELKRLGNILSRSVHEHDDASEGVLLALARVPENERALQRL